MTFEDVTKAALKGEHNKKRQANASHVTAILEAAFTYIAQAPVDEGREFLERTFKRYRRWQPREKTAMQSTAQRGAYGRG